MDAAILLPALLIVVAGTTRRWLKLAGALLLSPPAALLLVSQPPWSHLTQAGLAVFFFATVLDLRSADRRLVEMREPQPQSLPGFPEEPTRRCP